MTWLERLRERKMNAVPSPYWSMVGKEVSDHVHSWRFWILLAIIMLTCLASLYTSTMSIRGMGGSSEGEGSFFFLRLFTLSDGTIPSFITFVSFLGPLLGIGIGFDAINSERNRGTLSRIMAQPIHRDALLNAKFVAGVIVITALFGSLTFLVMGSGLLALGIPPTPEEFLRMLAFLVIAVAYVAFWLNLSLTFSVVFRQPATSALAGIAVWLFFSIFYGMIVNLLFNAWTPSDASTIDDLISYGRFVEGIASLSPAQLFSDATATLMTPETRTTTSFLSPEVAYGAIPGPLPLGQSLLLVWPQITGLIAVTLICFAVAYSLFMRQEIRSR